MEIRISERYWYSNHHDSWRGRVLSLKVERTPERCVAGQAVAEGSRLETHSGTVGQAA